MNGRTHSPFELSIRVLAKELRFRENQTAVDTVVGNANPALAYYSTREIRRKYLQMIEKRRSSKRGAWYWDKRKEPHQVKNKRVSGNARSVTAVCRKRDLRDIGGGYLELKTYRYEELYRLCRRERFYGQPVAAGLMYTGVLVAADVVATAAHCAYESRVKNLCFLFDYKMDAQGYPRTRFLKKNVYRGLEILHRVYDVDGPGATGEDWALVRLDRKVEDREIVRLSEKPVQKGQSIFVLGHPCGLPMKYAPGGRVEHIDNSYYTSELDLYEGNSGSPAFCAQTSEMVGLVAGGDKVDFSCNDNHCNVSLVYPNNEVKSHGARLIKVEELHKLLKSLS